MGRFKYLKRHPLPPPLAPRYWYPAREGSCFHAELCDQAGRVGTLDPSLKHQDLRSSRVEGLGDWLLRTEEFINWDTGEDGVVSPILFCYGDPGVGKTHIGYELAFPCQNGGI